MDRAAMEHTFKNMYQIGYNAALKEGAVELNTEKLRTEIGQIKGIGENRLAVACGNQPSPSACLL